MTQLLIILNRRRKKRLLLPQQPQQPQSLVRTTRRRHRVELFIVLLFCFSVRLFSLSKYFFKPQVVI